MNLSIEMLNLWGQRAADFAFTMLWQSSLLIAIVWSLDFALRRRLRAAVRYALWLVVLAKLLLPPSLALPTGLGWWLHTTTAAVDQPRLAVVTYSPAVATIPSTQRPPALEVPAGISMSTEGWGLIACCAVALALLAFLMWRWRQCAQHVRQAIPAPEPINQLLSDACQIIGLHSDVQVRLTPLPMSPSVCGLFQPVILIPRQLAEQLPANQLRAVLIHELIHLQRRDLWVNCAQAILQIAYWWHPLVWLANAAIRRVREEAVDDAVVLALAEDADTYAPTLLEVAKMSFGPPLASLGLISILESRSALSRRIERLIKLSAPRKAGLTIISVLGIVAFAIMVVPMGNAPIVTFSEVPLSSQRVENRDPLTETLEKQSVGDTNKADGTNVLADSSGSNAVNTVLPIPPMVHSNDVVSSEKPADPIVTRTYTVDPQTFVSNLRASLNAKKLQVRIETQFIELANFNPASEAADSPLRILPANMLTNSPVHETAIVTNLRARFHPSEILRLITCANPTVTNILDEEQALTLLSKAKQQSGSDVLTAPYTLTTEGRQMHVSIQDMLTIVSGVVTNVTFDTNGKPRLSVGFSTTPIPFGPMLEILPKVDGTTISLSVNGSITEFLGYDEPGKLSKFSVEGATPLKYKQPLPRFRILQVSAQAMLKEGQTLMLAGPVCYDTAKIKDKVLILGDIPLLGGLFRSESSSQVKRHLIVLVTPTIVDSTGNRVHLAQK